MRKLYAGQVVSLKVKRKLDTYYLLDGGKEEIILHTNETKRDLDVNEEVEVFLYHNKQGKLVGTMSIPSLYESKYEWVEVVEVVKNLGVFVDIGIEKEILVSKDKLPLLEGVWPNIGDELFVTLTTDHRGRLLAEPITEEVVERERVFADNIQINSPVRGRVYRSTKVGSFIITEEGYRGFIHYSERKREPRLGEWVEGRVIAVKYDGTLNISLRPLKQFSMKDDSESILQFLQQHHGVMPYTDKSDPDEIRREFRISKAAFKRALGMLLKEKRIEQRDGKTYLIENKAD